MPTRDGVKVALSALHLHFAAKPGIVSAPSQIGAAFARRNALSRREATPMKRLCLAVAACSPRFASPPRLPTRARRTTRWCGPPTATTRSPIPTISTRASWWSSATTSGTRSSSSIPKTAEIKPLLATKWTWVNSTTLELELRKGVKFHSGKVMDADDVVYTLNFVSNKDERHRQLRAAGLDQERGEDRRRQRPHRPEQSVPAGARLSRRPRLHHAERALRQRAGEARRQEGLRRGASPTAPAPTRSPRSSPATTS